MRKQQLDKTILKPLKGKLTGQLTTLDINHLQGGIYIVKLSSQNKTAVKKFVKIW